MFFVKAICVTMDMSWILFHAVSSASRSGNIRCYQQHDESTGIRLLLMEIINQPGDVNTRDRGGWEAETRPGSHISQSFN